MTIAWHSLYLPTEETGTIVETLSDTLTNLGYTLYNPFGGTPGKSYPRTVRLFVAPPSRNWTRILGEFDARLLPSISQVAPCLSVALTDDKADITTYHNGEEIEVVTALTPYLRPDYTADDLGRALRAPIAGDKSDQSTDFSMDWLPDDLQEQAQSLNPKHINRLFGKLMRKVNKQIGTGDADSARALLQSGADWHSPAGKRIHAVMRRLTVPENWYKPDFVILRDAYQLHLRRQKTPDAILYPGDREAMDAVPDALDYTPVYGGIND